MGVTHYLTLETSQPTSAAAAVIPLQWKFETRDTLGNVTQRSERYATHREAVKAFAPLLRGLPPGTELYLVNPQGAKVRVR